jgi:hypothetical protein
MVDSQSTGGIDRSDLPWEIFVMSRADSLSDSRSRRSFLIRSSVLSLTIPAVLRSAEAQQRVDIDLNARKRVHPEKDPLKPEFEKLFEKAGLPKPSIQHQGRFVAIGTGRPEFTRRVLHIAENTSAGYIRFFTGLKLPARKNEDPMIVIILANAGQYSRFNGENKARNEGGHYDIDQNWTVTFDQRGRSRSVRSDLERANDVTMIHEIAHQLSFNTGLLSRDADIPMIISEGLATMAEPSDGTSMPGFSEVNRPRLDVLVRLLRLNKRRWISLKDLIQTDDPFFDADDNVVQAVYSQSWLLWDTIIHQRRFRERLGPYLERVNTRRDATKRLDDFVDSFGSIKAVEDAMSKSLTDLTAK